MSACTRGWLLLLVVTCCNQPAPAGPPPSEAALHRDEPEAHRELPRLVRLPPEVLAAAGIRTEPAAQRPLPLTVELSGEIAADPDRVARLTARVPGRIAEVRCREGHKVQAGALLVVLESAELAQARAAYAAARARAEAAARHAERLENLQRSGLAAAQEVQSAAAEARSLQAAAQAAQQTLLTYGLPAGELERPGGRLELRAPLSAAVARRDAVVGQTVGPDHVLCELVDLQRAYFVGRLFEKNLGRVRPGEAAEVRLNAYPDEVFLGTVESIGKQLDPAARTVVARIAIADRNDLLKIGLFGTARVSTSDPAPPALLVPLQAVTRLADRDVVFVRHPDDHFEVHPVVLGRSAGGQVEVLSGLRAGEQVVSQGVFTLKSAVLRSTFAAEE
ncbi:MAG: efflux RND transporter periplasmic adaptor subunit [Myxococcales bacterium]|nr:efflux RND transporter periplasmic adaptor subunit [Myxococcota bacterium]MDW8282247.1 efflux RND transporter periplasmic adaptor subunit [Myxococcales bacterium]